MRRTNLIIFVLFLLVAAAVVAGQFLFGRARGSFLNPEPPITVTVLYSSELSRWLVPATEQFNADKRKVSGRQVTVQIEQMDDGDAMRSILSGARTPTAWIPASTIWVNLLNNEWRGNHESDLILRSGEYGTVPLALTPMVFVMFKERADRLVQKFPNPDWADFQRAITTPGGWKELGGDPDWGNFKYGQTDPRTSNAGLLAVTLATYSYFNKTGGLTIADTRNEEYRNWMRGLASGLVDNAPPTAAQQMDDLVRYGPSRYDVVSIYENLVIPQIKNAAGRFGPLHVLYPRLNVWSDHPYSVLASESSSAEDKDAALLFENYLYSPPLQQQALKVGFRPANPDVPLLTGDAENPFNQYKDAGLLAKIPRPVLADIPSGDVLRSLQTVFER